MTELFRRGYRDALLGEDWILEDMPPTYYDGVRKAKIQQAFWED